VTHFVDDRRVILEFHQASLGGCWRAALDVSAIGQHVEIPLCEGRDFTVAALMLTGYSLQAVNEALVALPPNSVREAGLEAAANVPSTFPSLAARRSLPWPTADFMATTRNSIGRASGR